MSEHFDTQITDAAGAAPSSFPGASNWDATSNIPPIHVKTWSHTGAFFDSENISEFLKHEYYRPTSDSDHTLLGDSEIMGSFPGADSLREGLRTLRGATLREEIYSLDGGPKAGIPYAVTEHNYKLRMLQPQHNPAITRSTNPSIWSMHPSETLNCHYERNSLDPRVTHEMVFEIDKYGSNLRILSIAYGRMPGQSTLYPADIEVQQTLKIN